MANPCKNSNGNQEDLSYPKGRACPILTAEYKRPMQGLRGNCNFQYEQLPPQRPPGKQLHTKEKLLRIESKLMGTRMMETKKGEGSDKHEEGRKGQQSSVNKPL